jgi:hypothetical protein
LERGRVEQQMDTLTRGEPPRLVDLGHPLGAAAGFGGSAQIA